MNKADRARMYEKYLREEGFSPKIDNEGDVVFNIGNESYIIPILEDDPELFRILFPNFWAFETERDHMCAVFACADVLKNTKCAKVIPLDGNVSGCVDIFCPPELFHVFFKRCISALRSAVHLFIKSANARQEHFRNQLS